MVDHEIEEIVRQPIYPEEEVPEIIDFFCLYHFNQWLLKYDDLGVKSFLEPRFGPNLPKVIKYAGCLTFKSTVGLNSYQIFRYLDLVYRYTRRAISREAHIEIVFGCYFMLTFALEVDMYPIDEIVYHANGFLLSLREILSLTVSYHEINLFVGMWDRLSTRIIRRALQETWEKRHVLFPVLETASAVLSPATCKLARRLIDGADELCPDVVTILIRQVDLYFRHYLTRRKTLQVSDSLKAEISKRTGAQVNEALSILGSCSKTKILKDTIPSSLMEILEAIASPGLYLWPSNEDQALQLILLLSGLIRRDVHM